MMLLVLAIVATGLAQAGQAQLPPHPGLAETRAMAATTPGRRPPPLTLSGEKTTRTVDCRQGDVTVTADRANLTLNNCASIVVAGSHDHITAHLAPAGAITILGDDDVVRWIPAEGYPVEVKDQGHRNTDAPL